MIDELSFRRLRWRSRRGMLELDLLLVPFTDEVFRELPPADQETYEKLLAQDDPDLLSWFGRKEIPEDPDFARLVNLILARVQPK